MRKSPTRTNKHHVRWLGIFDEEIQHKDSISTLLSIGHNQVTRDRFEVPVFDHSYLLDPGVRNSNSTIAAVSSNYIKNATRHEPMKRPTKTHILKAVPDVSIGYGIMLMKNLWTEWRIWQVDILSSDVIDPREEPPYVLLVHFDRYDNGPDTIHLMVGN